MRAIPQPDKPIAWLIRQSGHKGQAPHIMSGRIYLDEGSARAAAARLTNRYWLCQAVPVFEPTGEQLRSLQRDRDPVPPRQFDD